MLKKTKILLSSFLITSLCVALTACGGGVTGVTSGKTTAADSASNSQATTAASKGGASGELVLTGSTSMADVGNALAEAFMAANPEVTISVGGNGSGEGPTAVKEGTAQIGMLSRDLKDSETPADFKQQIIGHDGIAVVVNPASTVTELTKEQVTKIFAGEIKNWKELGGADAPIQAIGREAASGTRGAFEELLKLEAPVYAEEQNSTGNVKQSVISNPNAIGYISVSALDESIKGVTIDGVVPSEATIQAGDYTLKRPFLMIVKANDKDELTNLFLEFVMSAEGQQIVLDNGVVPAAK